MEIDCISHKSTGYFSQLITDYLEQHPDLQSFYHYAPTDAGLAQAIADRKQYPIDRTTLVTVVERQYSGLEMPAKVKENIQALANKNTFTVCTAHQPNLLTGYLYFIYKILHAVKLAEHLQSQHTAEKFVPIFYMGTEDNDLDELGVFRYNQQKFRWKTDQTGAVGRMNTSDLQPLLQELYRQLGPPGDYAEQLTTIIKEAYEQQPTIAAATRHIVNALLGSYGVVVIDPDDADLKRTFLPILKQELLAPKAYDLVKTPSESLNQQYKAQAFARPINLFYLKDDLRERIERSGDTWKVVHSTITWDKQALTVEMEQYPERFSPNVILRGLFQEIILPNVAFIGGGSEVAYWMQLLPLFRHYQVFYPTLVLRQSLLWMPDESLSLQQKTQCSDEELFLPTEVVTREFVKKHTHKDLELETIRHQLQEVFLQLKQKAVLIDSTLSASSEAALSKIRYQVSVLEKKMMRAEKRNMGIQLAQLYKLKHLLFPNNSLQERQENFMDYFLLYGPAYFEELYRAMLPYGDSFMLIKDKQ